MGKETFIIRTEWWQAISELEPTDQAMILANLFHYHNGEEVNLPNLSVRLVWKLIEPNLQRNIVNYDKRRDTSSENGKKGGRPAKQSEENLNNLKEPIAKPIQIPEPNETLSVSVSVSDPVSVSALPSGDACENGVSDFKQFWAIYGKPTEQHKCEHLWYSMEIDERRRALETVAAYVASTPEIRYRKKPLNWLEGKCWNDELPSITPKPEKTKLSGGLL